MSSNEESKPLVLVDGSSYLFRAYHALPPLMTTGGQATGAIKGVINMIRSLIKNYPGSNVAVVFDAKGKTFRHDMYQQYKANRPPMPDDLRSQIEPIHQIIKAMGLPLIVVEGVEADDVLGTLAEQAGKLKIDTVISTGDKDLAQLVNEHVSLLNTMNNEKLDREGVITKFGLPPESIIEYLGLMGDKADNIPGVPSVGPKTALKWLNEHGSIENLIANAEQVKGKVGEKLRDNIDQLLLSCELATIRLDVELEFTPTELRHSDPDNAALLALFQEFGFKSWIKELETNGQVEAGNVQASKASPTSNEAKQFLQNEAIDIPEQIVYGVVSREEDLLSLIRQIKSFGSFAFSLVTDGSHYKSAKIIGLSLCVEAGSASYIPLGHDYVGVENQLTTEHVIELLRPVFENKHLFKTGHNLKLAAHILINYGIKLEGARFDVMLQSYVLDSVAHKHSLDKLSEHYLQQEKVPLQDLLGTGRKKLSFSQVEIEKAGHWMAQEADFCQRLSRVLTAKLNNTGLLADIYQYYEIALMPVLFQMEENGFKINVNSLGIQSNELAKRLVELEKAAFELAGEEFNLSSPKQLQKIFYEKLNFPIKSKTSKGQPSTAEPVLQELAQDYELPKVILEHRSLNKLKSTYTDKLPLETNPQTKRIHSNFQQAVAATGRLSSTEPNLQNIPIRTAEGRRIRQAFVAEEGKMLMAADYSQVELRIMAHLSNDEGLLNAFSKGLDVHKATASEIFSVSIDDVSNDQRRSAKAINFGLIYGMSAFGLAKQLGINRHEAQEYVARYFQRYPGVQEYMDSTKIIASEQGYVETIFGRRLYLPTINASNGMLRKAAERTAINAPMQGTAADIIKRAMVDIDHWLRASKLDGKMVSQVHDELVFEVAEQDLELISQGVRFRMSSAAALNVPLVVDIGSGDNWQKAH